MSSVKAKHRPVYRMKRFWLCTVLVLSYGLLISCSGTRVLMKTAPSTPKGLAPTPALSLTSRAEWESKARQNVKSQLETYVYGQYPQGLTLTTMSNETLSGQYFEDTATIQTERLKITNPANGQSREFGMVNVRPVDANTSTPVIMMENFCPNHNVIPVSGIPKPDGDYFSCDGDGMMSHMFGYFFGRYITTPPIAEIMSRGYALSVIYPTEFIPDRAVTGETELNDFFNDQPEETRTRAIMAWAKQFSLLSSYLKSEYDVATTIAYGHSRYGKSALVAAAYDSTIDGVIAHQSGTGGASLFKDKHGESIENVTESYPHWFSHSLKSYADNKTTLPVDQHLLLALIAPRPILLGNARRDVWSDPNGAFKSAMAASEVYRLYNENGLEQDGLTAFNSDADISFWMRPGTHGVVKEDWPAFLEFLDSHFK